MKSFAPQHVLNGSAYIHASQCAYNPFNKEWVDECVAILRGSCQKNFPEDEPLEADVRECAQYTRAVHPRQRASRLSSKPRGANERASLVLRICRPR